MKAVRTALAATAVTSAALAGALVANPAAASSATPATPAAPACGAAAPGATAKPPLIDITGTGSGLDIKGSLHQAAGPIRFRLHAQGREREIAVLRFRDGYTATALRKDLRASFEDDKFHKEPWTRVLKSIVAHGGVDAHRGKTVEMTIVLRPGTYYVFDDSGDLPRDFHKLVVNPITCAGDRGLPATSATVTMTGEDRFGGDTVLPATGSILVKNTAHDFEHLHFMSMTHVKDGTTRAQVLKSFKQQKEADFFLAATAGTDILSPQKKQVLTYSLPRGTYVLTCWIPDLDGTPHAIEGMVRIVELR